MWMVPQMVAMALLTMMAMAPLLSGTVVMVGSNGMAMGFGSNSKQASILTNVSGNAGAKVTISDSSGKEILSYTTAKISICSGELSCY